MNVIFILLPLALILGFGFLYGFLRMVWSGQYDELETPAHRMLLDDEVVCMNNEVVRLNKKR
jgi:cbb3-type cytochrome oxidase maturation protein